MNPSDILAAEILERAIRICGLVQRAIRPLLAAGQKGTAQIVSAERIELLLTKLVIQELSVIFCGTDTEEAKVEQLRALMEVVAIVHEGTLPTVPRIVEPIELHSYLRQGFGTDSSKELRARPNILVFAAERLGMQVYPSGLAGLLEQLARRNKQLARARLFSSDIKQFGITTLEERPNYHDLRGDGPSTDAYVAIPAVDLHNPTRWPSLWHELGHHELKRSNPAIIERFKSFLNDGSSSSVKAFDSLCLEVYRLAIDREQNHDDLSEAELSLAQREGGALTEAWLRECWCDAYGVRQAGLGFLYSQLHDFMFCWPSYLSKNFVAQQPYPPAWFRLRLSRNLAIERLKHQNQYVDKTLEAKLTFAFKEEERVFQALEPMRGDGEEFRGQFANLFTHFLQFLKHDIDFSNQRTLAGDISCAEFEELEEDLRSGLPIPSITSQGSTGSRAAQVSEIVLAGWRTRNSSLRANLLKEFSGYCTGETPASSYIQRSIELIDRSDDSIKRSIQVAEWFSILCDVKRSDIDTLHVGTTSQAETQSITPVEQTDDESDLRGSLPGLISDEEIKRLLRPVGKERPRLRIVPLISYREQVKGTVIDLRLGHNFEIFQNIGQTAIDPCDPDADNRVDSLETEVDFLKGLHVLPGQFVLGHTLEYIRLPRDIAAQIEGRSSFARLGIQIHMTANLVEAGFEGCLTLEIHNNGPSAVVLYPGMRLAQLRFFRISGRAEETYSRIGNKYHGQLSQNRTKQFADPEVGIFRKHIELERAKAQPKEKP